MNGLGHHLRGEARLLPRRILVLVPVVCTSVGVAAPKRARPKLEVHQITLPDTKLPEALALIARKHAKALVVETTLPTMRVHLSTSYVHVEELFRSMFDQAGAAGFGLDCRTEKGRYVVFRHPIQRDHVEVPIPLKQDTLTTKLGPIRATFSDLRYLPPSRLRMRWDWRWPEGLRVVGLHDTLPGIVSPRVKLKSGRVVALSTQSREAGGPNGTQEVEGRLLETAPGDPPVALVWDVAWWPRVAPRVGPSS